MYDLLLMKKAKRNRLAYSVNFNGSISDFPQIFEMKEKVKKKKKSPIFVGHSVLDPRKLMIYDFQYDYMIPKQGKNVKIKT